MRSAATVEQRLEDRGGRASLPVAKRGGDLERQLPLLLVPLESREELLAEPGERQLHLHGAALAPPEILRPRARHRQEGGLDVCDDSERLDRGTAALRRATGDRQVETADERLDGDPSWL